MVNTATIIKGQARREAATYRKVQAFWNSGSAVATIGGLTFTRFTASRHLSLNSAHVARYLDGLEGKKANALRRKAPACEGILQ